MYSTNKKKTATNILRIIAFMVLTAVMASSAIFAAGEFTHSQVNISGRHIIENNESLRTARHTFVLTAKDNAPMPDGSDSGVKKVTINSNETFDFGDITYSKPGTYAYTVSRELLKTENLEEDDSVYRCNVAVFSDGSTIIVFSKSGTEGKPNTIEYRDTYIAPADDKDSTSRSGRVRTGDSHAIYLYEGILAAACIALVIVIGRRRKGGDKR